MIYEDVPNRYACIHVDLVNEGVMDMLCDFVGVDKSYNICREGNNVAGHIRDVYGEITNGCWVLKPLDKDLGTMKAFVENDERFKSCRRAFNG